MTAQDARTTAARPDVGNAESPQIAEPEAQPSSDPANSPASEPANSPVSDPASCRASLTGGSTASSSANATRVWLRRCHGRIASLSRDGLDLIADWRESLAPIAFPPVCVLCGEITDLTQVTPVTQMTAWGGARIAHREPAILLKGTAGGGAFRKPSVRPRRYRTFCRTCDTSISHSYPLMRESCERCGWPRPRSVPAGCCARCDAMSQPHAFCRICPLYRYQDAVCDAIVAAKFPSNAAVIREMGLRLSEAIFDRWSGADFSDPSGQPLPPIVTNVPTSWRRQIRRGGSGTQLLAKQTATRLGIVYRSLLGSTRSIHKQAWLDDDARRENVRGAFAVRRSQRRWVAGQHFILVDDVMTTGSTANEVAGVLLQAGAASVSMAVVALAIRDG